MAVFVCQDVPQDSCCCRRDGFDNQVHLWFTGSAVNSLHKKNVPLFVAKELSTLENVTSTATHFVLRRYKELDVELLDDTSDDRGSFSF